MKRTIFIIIAILSIPVLATVTITTVKTGELDADGDTTAFAFSFPYNATSEIKVDVITDAGDVATRQVETSDYSVSPSSSTSGGTVTFGSAPDDGNYVIISRTTSVTQDSDLDAGAYTSRTSIEDAFDEVYRILQEHDDAITRSIRAPQGEITTDFVLPGALTRASSYPCFSSTGAFTVSNTYAPTSATVSTFMETVLDDTTAAAARTTLGLDNLMQIYNVKDPSYGASGNGSDNDTTKIQAAIDACTSGGVGTGVVYLPTGIYMVSNLTIPPAIRIVGENMHTSVLKAISGTTGNIIEDSGSAAKIMLFNFAIHGNDQNVIGINLGNNTTQFGTYSWVDRVWCRDCDTGMYYNLNAGAIGDIYVTDFLDDGVILQGAANWIQSIWVVGATADTPDKGVHLYGLTGSFIETIHAEGDMANPLYFEGSTNTVRRFYLSVGAGVTITDAIYIEGTRLYNQLDNIEINLTAASSACTNLVNDQYTGDTIPWQGGAASVACNGYRQGGRLNLDVVYVDDAAMTIEASSCPQTVVFDNLTANRTLTLPTLPTGYPTITVINNSDIGNEYKVWVAAAAADAAKYVGGRAAAFPLYPQQSITLRGVDSNIASDKAWLRVGGQNWNQFTRQVELTNADVVDLADTAIELVAAPGTGRLLEFVSAVLILDYSGGALAEPSAPDDLAIEYNDGTGTQIVTWDTTGFITATADAMEIVNSASVGGGASAVATATNVNKNIALVNTGTDYTVGSSTSTMTVIVTWREHNTLGL